MSRRRFALLCSACVAPAVMVVLILALAAPAAAGPAETQGQIIWNYFDSLSAGTRVAEQYASQHLHFINDYQAGEVFRASPQITAHPNANSGANVLVNTSYDSEIFSSANVPLVYWFDVPVAGVGMVMGTPTSCTSAYPATVTIHDCNGAILDTKTVTVTSEFDTMLQMYDPGGERIRSVRVSYGGSTCPEAIDSLAYQLSTGAVCTDTTAPVVTITSHQNFQTVNQATISLRGVVTETSGIIKSLKVNGGPAQITPSSTAGVFTFQKLVNLNEGSNTVTVLATDAADNKGSASIVLNRGTPTSVSIAQFHLTQRGVMTNTVCDVDTPLVAGKSTLVRLHLNVRTATGAATYADGVKLTLWRDTYFSPDVKVGEYWGTTTSPYLSAFDSPSEMAGIHFWLDGDQFDTAGDYKFEFQAYNGLTPILGPQVASCGGSQYFEFDETDSMQILLLPVEAGLNSTLNASDHYANAAAQLHALERTYPVRDGVEPLWWKTDAGVRYAEVNPLHLCDGSAAMQQSSNFCGGTGWTWKMIDRDASGILRRADYGTVTNAAITTCVANDHIIGGRVSSSATFTYAFDSQLGIFRGGAHPGWLGAKAAGPLDEDHDGDIDNADMAHYVAEFLDAQSGQWRTNLAQGYEHGETFRFFRDQDNNRCNGRTTEPQADVRTLWENMQGLLFTPAALAMNWYNNVTAAGTANDVEFATMWFPKKLTAIDNGAFGSYGPGSSQPALKSNWIVVDSTSTLAHELGHNKGNLPDLYTNTECQRAETREPAWATYVDYESVPTNDIFAVMACDRAANRVIHLKAHYQTLFDRLDLATAGAAQEERGFGVAGAVSEGGGLLWLETAVAENAILTPTDPDSPLRLVLYVRGGEPSEYGIPFEGQVFPPQGYDTWEATFTEFRAVVPYPDDVTAAGLFLGRELLGRWARSEAPPAIYVEEPRGGSEFESYGEARITWDWHDPDSEQVVFSIDYSPDGGESWLPVAANLPGSEFIWDLSSAPGTAGRSGLIRVTGNDGFNTGSGETAEPFAVAGKPPGVAIISPSPEREFSQCAPVHLKGAAHDPENRLAAVYWAVDGPAVSEELTAQIGPLPPGPHHVVLTAVDDEELIGVAETTIFVYGDADCDGMSDEFEEHFGFDPGNVVDAGWDLDEDELPNFDEAWRRLDPRNPDTDGDGYPDGVEVREGSDPGDPDDTPWTPPAGERVHLPLLLRR